MLEAEFIGQLKEYISGGFSAGILMGSIVWFSAFVIILLWNLFRDIASS